MRNLKLTLQYDGTNYFGWQRQSHTRSTIQEILQAVLQKVLGGRPKLIAAGRTDAGVHALGQVVNFKTAHPIVPHKLKQALNALLPADIKVSAIGEVPPDFHARYSVKEKTYRYQILNRPYSDVFRGRYVYYYAKARLDVAAMRRAARMLVGSHDFSSFKITGGLRERSPVRDIRNLRVSKKGTHITIEVRGKSFLHKMVRSIVGTLIEVGRGKLPVERVRTILRAKSRRAAGPTAPACGLCLMKVRY